MSNIPQPIKTRLAELAVFPEKYTMGELAYELRILSYKVAHLATIDDRKIK